MDLDKNQREREVLRKRYMVFKANKRKSIKQKEREFANSFSQHKNLIVKHASLGEKRRRENEYKEKMRQKKHTNSCVPETKAYTETSMASMRSFLKSGRYHAL